MIEVPGDEEEGMGVLVLKLRDDSVDLICSCSSDCRAIICENSFGR